MQREPWRFQAIHLGATAILLIALVPVLHRVHFPLRWNWGVLLASFAGLGWQAVALAAVLYAIQEPGKLWSRLRSHYFSEVRRILLFIAFAALLLVAAGVRMGVLALIDGVAALEVLQGKRLREGLLREILPALLPAAGYLFMGLVLAFTYTNAIVRLRFFGAYDPVFNRIDARLFGTTVSALAHRVASLAPAGLFKFLDFIYYGMFAQIGAGLLICGMYGGAKRSIQFVGAIALGYYIALVMFWLWPSHGPYYTCVNHFLRLPSDLNSYRTQKYMLADARYLWAQKLVRTVPMGFYIAFPCMHIAQPLIVMWFLRRWKRMVAVLAAYDVVLIAAIILLEWHYFTDLLGGVAVAGLSIVLTARRFADEATPEPAPVEAAAGASTGG